MCHQLRARAVAITLAMLLCIGSVGGGSLLLDIAATGGDPIALRLA